MRTFVLLIFLLPCSQSFAQNDIVERLLHVRFLLSDTPQYNPSEALSELLQIEEQCTSSDNDTIKAFFSMLEGQALFNMHRNEECIPLCKKAIDLFEQCNFQQYDFIDTYQIIVMSYHRLMDYDNAEDYCRKGLLKSITADIGIGPRNQMSAFFYYYLGKIYEIKGDTLLANECFERNKQFQDKQSVDIDELYHIELENSYWDKINSFVQSKLYQEAVDMYSDLIKIIEGKRGKNQKYILAVYSKALLLCRYLNRFDEAFPLFVEVVNCGKKASILNESVCGAYCNIALCYAYNGDFSKLEHFILDASKILILR